MMTSPSTTKNDQLGLRNAAPTEGFKNMIDLISYLIAGLWLIGGIAFAAAFTAGMIGLDDAFERARRGDPD